jgi:hypothetical protein
MTKVIEVKPGYHVYSGDPEAPPRGMDLAYPLDEVVEINDKRCPIIPDGMIETLKGVCPACGGVTRFTDDYLSHPRVNEYESYSLVCGDCGEVVENEVGVCVKVQVLATVPTSLLNLAGDLFCKQKVFYPEGFVDVEVSGHPTGVWVYFYHDGRYSLEDQCQLQTQFYERLPEFLPVEEYAIHIGVRFLDQKHR